MDGTLAFAGRQFRHGSLTVATPRGARLNLGHGSPHAVIRLRDDRTLLRILTDPEYQFGQTYIEGRWQPEGCSLQAVLAAALRMAESRPKGRIARALSQLRSRLGEVNWPTLARLNVHRHYDLSPALYATFLDQDMHYSCAYFRDPQNTLEQAQQDKCARIAAKLALRPGSRVLDIGCGWGSLAMYLAEHHDVEVLGITLSEEQLAVARRRARERGLESRVRFELQDYRSIDDRFNAISSVGMFEHVGRPQYRRFFSCLKSLLKPDGTALLHTIARSGPPGATNRWIRKHIFPGGYIPAASEVMAPLQDSGLCLNDLEVWRMHYAFTLAEWNRRFQRHRNLFATELGERFCRLWEFYLLSCEAAFRQGMLVVLHFQITRSADRLPLTRDYLAEGKSAAAIRSQE